MVNARHRRYVALIGRILEKPSACAKFGGASYRDLLSNWKETVQCMPIYYKEKGFRTQCQGLNVSLLFLSAGARTHDIGDLMNQSGVVATGSCQRMVLPPPCPPTVYRRPFHRAPQVDHSTLGAAGHISAVVGCRHLAVQDARMSAPSALAVSSAADHTTENR